MPDGTLGDRGKNLEDAYFAKHDEELRARLRERHAAESQREALSAASGISDEESLDHLMQAGIHAETVAALALVPLVEVAWADGHVHDREREVVIAAAEEAGLTKGSPGHDLLEAWLDRRPEPTLLTAWQRFVGALSDVLSAEDGQSLERDLMASAQNVATSTGGFLGRGNRVSPAEQAILDELQRAFC